MVWRGVDAEAWAGTATAEEHAEQAEVAVEMEAAAGATEAAEVAEAEAEAEAAGSRAARAPDLLHPLGELPPLRERVVLCVGRVSATKGQDLRLETRTLAPSAP